MKVRATVRDQVRSTWPVILAIIAVSTILMGLVVIARFGMGIPTFTLTADPAAVAGAPFYTGFLSTVGLFLWVATGAVCLFTGAILRGRGVTGGTRTFLLLAGGISLALGLDDAFMLHETAIPGYIGLPEEIVLATYGVVICVFVVVFLRTILGTDYLILCMAALFFATSVALDVSEPTGIIGSGLFEEGAKMVGQVCWLAYFSLTAAAVERSTELPVTHPASPRSTTS